MIFATLVLGAPNRLTAIAYADVAFRPVRSFQEPARIMVAFECADPTWRPTRSPREGSR